MSHPSQVRRRTRSKTVKNCEFLGNWLGTLTYQRYSKIHCTIPVKTFKIHNWIVKKPIHLSSWHKCVFWESIFRSQHFLGPHFPLNKKKRNPDRTKEAVDDSAEKQTSSELHYQEFGRSCSRWCRQTLSVSGDEAARSSMIWKLFSYIFMYFHVFSNFNRNETTIAEHFISRFWGCYMTQWGYDKQLGDANLKPFLAVTRDNNPKKTPTALSPKMLCVKREVENNHFNSKVIRPYVVSKEK